MELGQPIFQKTNADEGINNFMRGFALVAQQNAHKQAQELALQKMQNQIQEQQSKDELEKARLGLDNQRIQNTAQHFGQMYELGQARNELNTTKFQNALNQDKQDTTRLIDFTNQMAGIDEQEGTQAWQNKANLVRSNYADVVSTPEGQRIWRQSFDGHKFSARTGRQAQNDIMRDYYKTLSSNGLNDYSFANPGVWGTNADGSKFLPMDDKGIIVPVGSKTATRFKTLPQDQFQTLKAQHDRIKDLLTQPDAKPADVPTSTIPVIKTPDDYNSIQPGSSYVDPNGVTRQKPDAQSVGQ